MISGRIRRLALINQLQTYDCKDQYVVVVAAVVVVAFIAVDTPAPVADYVSMYK